MKKLLPILLLFIAFSGFSQKVKVKVKKDVAMVNKVPYLQIEVKKKGLGSMRAGQFKSIEGEPLVDFETFNQDCNFGRNYLWHELKFTGTETQVDIPYYDVTPTKKKLVAFFYENELFTDGKLNEAALAKLKEKFPEPLGEQYRAKGKEEKVLAEKLKLLPERNLKATIRLDGNRIFQGDVLIGKWEKYRPEHAMTDRIRIMNPEGISAGVNDMDGYGKMSLKTGRDGIKHDLTKWAAPNADWGILAKQIAVFMMKHGYL